MPPRSLCVIAVTDGKDSEKRGTRSVILDPWNPGTLRNVMSEWIFKEESDGVTFKVRVQPNASRNEIVGVMEGALRIRLAAPPVEGAANKECIRFLSKKLHLAKSRITLVKGERSREKTFRVEGKGKDDLQKALLGG